MSSPLETPEFEHLYLGNTADDDGPIVDGMIQTVSAPATPVVEAIHPATLIEPARTTRLLSGTQTFDFTAITTYGPIQILPADKNRQDLTIKAYSFSATSPVPNTEFVYIADENGKLGSSSSGKLRAASSDFDLSEHTGAVYILPGPGLTANFEVSWWATTL
jgi:hypothetical protein